jgi:hypothetical protein
LIPSKSASFQIGLVCCFVACCIEQSRSSNQHEQQDRVRGGRACHSCGETGHLKRDCPHRGSGGEGRRRHQNTGVNASSAQRARRVVEIGSSDMAQVIGKGGATIKRIERESGARCQSDFGSGRITVTGKDAEVQAAEQLIHAHLQGMVDQQAAYEDRQAAHRERQAEWEDRQSAHRERQRQWENRDLKSAEHRAYRERQATRRHRREEYEKNPPAWKTWEAEQRKADPHWVSEAVLIASGN